MATPHGCMPLLVPRCSGWCPPGPRRRAGAGTPRSWAVGCWVWAATPPPGVQMATSKAAKGHDGLGGRPPTGLFSSNSSECFLCSLGPGSCPRTSPGPHAAQKTTPNCWSKAAPDGRPPCGESKCGLVRRTFASALSLSLPGWGPSLLQILFLLWWAAVGCWVKIWGRGEGGGG